MKKKLFLLNSENINNNDAANIFKDYMNYLEEIKNDLPSNVYDIFSNPYYYDSQNHKCPHDGWIETLLINERYTKENRQDSIIDITIKLLGAYHDYFIYFNYKNVINYSLEMKKLSQVGNKGHGDWLIDEISLVNNNILIHEIEFSSKAQWRISCTDLDISYEEIV
jgi:hypothetical protein